MSLTGDTWEGERTSRVDASGWHSIECDIADMDTLYASCVWEEMRLLDALLAKHAEFQRLHPE